MEKERENQQKLLKVIGHLKVNSEKPLMMKAWNSWVQFKQERVMLKEGLKRALAYNHGLRRCWKLWRRKDADFNNTLQHESRGAMIDRHKQLSHLLRSYNKDMNDSEKYLGQLSEVNKEQS